MTHGHDHRHVMLEGAFNMRDMGGIRTSDGYQVRMGRLFRSDALHGLTETDLELLGGYGFATVVDLRLEQEIAFLGKAKLLELGARHIHLPLLSDDPVLPPGTPMPPNLGDLYTLMLSTWPDRFVQAVATLADWENLPAVFHCAAGKDRTGITAAFIYSVLGVDREEIIADYVLTDANMERIIAAEAANPQPATNNRQRPPASYDRAEARTISTLLETLDEQFGSPVEWLRLNGLPDRAIDALRRELLD